LTVQKFVLHSALCLLNFTILACAARMPPRPAGAPTPDPTAAAAFATATAHCDAPFRSAVEGELSLSGRAGGERVRGRVLFGLQEPGSIRLEAPAPFGAPFFILAGERERATLYLPRERRVLKDTGVADVMERITGLALGADDLRFIMSGCLVDKPALSEGRQWGADWKAVTIGPDRVAYLRMQNGRPVLTAADYGSWHVDYSEHNATGIARRVRVRRASDNAVDVTARIDQFIAGGPINPRAWTVEVSPGTEAMTLDELRSIAPLVEKPQPLELLEQPLELLPQ
jgi:outer membrane biogenesis lipoprotein LolB